MVLLVNIVTEWCSHPVGLCFKCVFRHTALYLFGKLCGIVLGIAFKN